MANELIPASSFLGKGVPGTLKIVKSDKKGTKGYEGLVEVTQKGPWFGTQHVWRKYLTEGKVERVLEQLQTAGCTFPNDDTTDLTGWGSTEDVSLQMEHEPGGLRDPADPSKGSYPDRAICAWINESQGLRGHSEITEPAEKAAFLAESKGALAASRAKRAGGKTGAASAPADNIPRNQDGTPKF